MRLPDLRSNAVLVGRGAGRLASALADPVTGGFDNARCFVFSRLPPEEKMLAQMVAAEDTFLISVGDTTLPDNVRVLLSRSRARNKVLIGEDSRLAALTGFDVLLASAESLVDVLRSGLPDQGELISLGALAQAVGQPGTHVQSDLAIARNPTELHPARPRYPTSP